MNSININNNNYILADLLLENNPEFCNNARNARELIKDKKIENPNYIFGRYIDNKWILSDGKSRKYDKVLILKSFIENILDNDTQEIKILPPKINLLDNEKFRDHNNNIIEITTVGTKNIDDIYFRVKDISKGFELPNIQNTIIDKRTNGYRKNIHYTFFYCKKVARSLNKTNGVNKTIVKKELYLTYHGLLRLLFVSNSKQVEKFISWAMKILFTHQMGSSEERKTLAADLSAGIPYNQVKEYIKTFSNDLSCIYLISIGSVKNLRNHMNIPNEFDDNNIIYKYGYTKDLTKRMEGHKQNFKNIPNVNLSLKKISIIDTLYVSQAETSLKEYVDKYKFKFKNFDELIILNKNELKDVEDKYSHINNQFSGSNKSLSSIINSLQTEIKELQNQNNNLIKDINNQKLLFEEKLASKDISFNDKKIIFEEKLASKDKDIQLIKKEIDLLNKDNELLKKELYIKQLELKIKNKK